MDEELNRLRSDNAILKNVLIPRMKVAERRCYIYPKSCLVDAVKADGKLDVYLACEACWAKYVLQLFPDLQPRG